MAPHENRFRLIEARCSPFARELLRHLERHPQISELLDMLERIDGQIFRINVENALQALNRD